MSDLNKTHVGVTTPHLMPRDVISKDLKALGGNYEVTDNADGSKSVSANYFVDTDSDASNGYVVVHASATYKKNQKGDGYTVVSGSAKMSAEGRNIAGQSNSALQKYVNSYTGQLLADRTKTMGAAMRILIPTYSAAIGEVPASSRPDGEFEVPVNVSSPSKVIVKLDGVELASKDVTAGVTKLQLKVPSTMSAGDKKLTFDFTDSVSKAVLPTDSRPMTITERVEAKMDSTFPKLSAATIKDIKVVGQASLEGVSVELLTLEAKKEVQEVGILQGNKVVKQKVEILVPTGKELAKTEYPKKLTLTNKAGQKIEIGRNLDENSLYKVQMKNAKGQVVWEGEFSIGKAAPGIKAGPPKIR